MRDSDFYFRKIDWLTIGLYFMLVFLGWINIYAAVYDEQSPKSIFDLSINSGIQLVWIGTAVLLIVLILVADYRLFENLSLILYVFFVVLLILTPFIGKEINGQKAWFEIGAFRLQPAEFAKFATALALAKLMEANTFDLSKLRYQLRAVGIIGLPVVFIMLQPDFGSAMVYSAFFIVLFREGMPNRYYVFAITVLVLGILAILVENNLIAVGIIASCLLILFFVGKKNWQKLVTLLFVGGIMVGYVYSIDYVVAKLPLHHQNRIMVLFDPDVDPLGVGWNVTQSKIAIGSGGLTGKGYLEGTQTKFDFVPEQHTDFIFCTLGEEFGWMGSFVVISLFITLLVRLIFLAERQKTRFSRVYGYGVVSILFFHFFINISMTVGLFPVIGIPLPFFSYGGSSLWAFTILLFIFIKLDSHRIQILGRLS
nr:rod shape-determining protein RodA [Cytophagales bacterium]